MNKCMMMGRLTADPNFRTANNAEQTQISRFTLAVQRNKDTADFIPCVAFNKTAELIADYVHKGQRLLCEGRWQTGSYKDKEDRTVYTHDLIVERVEFVEKREEDKK